FSCGCHLPVIQATDNQEAIMISFVWTAGPMVMALIFALTGGAMGGVLHGDRSDTPLGCDDGGSYGDDSDRTFCEMREQTIEALRGALTVDGGMNGGVRIKGWDRDQVLVRAKVQARARTPEEAKAIVSQIRLSTDGGQVSADGP